MALVLGEEVLLLFGITLATVRVSLTHLAHLAHTLLIARLLFVTGLRRHGFAKNRLGLGQHVSFRERRLLVIGAAAAVVSQVLRDLTVRVVTLSLIALVMIAIDERAGRRPLLI